MQGQNLEGDELWEYILKEVEREQQLKAHLIIAVERGARCFHLPSLKQEGFIHPSAKVQNTLQFSYFDQFGAVGDLEAESIKELVSKVVDLGFTICEKEDFKATVLAK